MSRIQKMCLGRCGRRVPADAPMGRCRGCYAAWQEKQAERDLKRHTTHDRARQGRFRDAVLRRDGGQCTAVLGNGRRCPVTENLIAHHTTPLASLKANPATDPYDPRHGKTLCAGHHAAHDRHARDVGGRCGCGVPVTSYPWEHKATCRVARDFEAQRIRGG